MNELFITCPDKIEPLLIQELNSLGIDGVRTGHHGVFAPKSIENVYKINYCSRIATRVLWPLAQFRCLDKDALYTASKAIPWLDFLDEKKTFAIDSNVTHPNIRNSLYGAQVMKDGLCDHIREQLGERPSVDIRNPDVQLNLHIHNNAGVISFDTSGAPLFKRGWRTLSSSASIQETLAAAILAHAGYTSEMIFCDPFCGSGTFLIEAALIATQTPPGMFRKTWGFVHLPEHNEVVWNAFKSEKDGMRIPLKQGSIFGADQDFEAVNIAKTHLQNIGLSDEILIEKSDIIRYKPKASPTLVISNPPFGKRLDTSEEVYRQLGQFLKRACQPPAKAYVLAPNSELMKEVAFPIQSTLPLMHGGLRIAVYRLKI